MNNMNTLEERKTKINRVARTYRPILASSNGDGSLPEKIELLKVGMWDTVNHGMFMIQLEDLIQMKENFDNGVAQVGNTGIVIDFDHDSRFGKSVAGGWVTGLEVGKDATGIDTLFGITEWTGLGKKELLEKNYRYISPEFYPECRGGWEDPEQYGHYIPNVLAAVALVNRPLFKGLDPIMASANSSEGRVEDKNNIIFVSASEKEKTMPTLEEVRLKDAGSLTEEEKSFLVEHKEELTAEEQAKFGFEVAQTTETEEQKKEREAAEAKAEEEKKAEEARIAAEQSQAPAIDLTKAQPILASAVKGDEGNVIVAAAELKSLVDFKRNSERKETEEFVKTHVTRGAIVASEIEKTVQMLMTAGSNRENLENMITRLPDNAVMASENGSSEKAGNAVSATEQIREKANAIVASAQAEGKSVDIGTAMSQVMKENPELGKQYQSELRGEN